MFNKSLVSQIFTVCYLQKIDRMLLQVFLSEQKTLREISIKRVNFDIKSELVNQ